MYYIIGQILSEKRPFFQSFPHFSKIEAYKKYELLIGVQYIILKPMKGSIQRKRNYLVVINKYVEVGIWIWTCSPNFEEILRKFPEIMGKYRILNGKYLVHLAVYKFRKDSGK